MVTHHKLLLVASHAGAPLGVLVSSDKQLDQPGDGALLPQSAVVGRTQSQVADQTNCGLDEEGRFGLEHCLSITLCKAQPRKKEENIDKKKKNPNFN